MDTCGVVHRRLIFLTLLCKSNCSGAKKCAVPKCEKHLPSLFVFLENPKSPNFTCPFESISILSGFTSRCYEL